MQWSSFPLMEHQWKSKVSMHLVQILRCEVHIKAIGKGKPIEKILI